MTDQKDKPNFFVQPLGRRETPAESLEDYVEVQRSDSDLMAEKHKPQFSEEEGEEIAKMVARGGIHGYISPKRDHMWVEPKDPTNVADQLASKPYTPESMNAIRRAARICSPKLSREVQELRESIVREITGYVDPKVRQMSFATNTAPQKSREEILEDLNKALTLLDADKKTIQKKWQSMRPKFWAVIKGCHDQPLSAEGRKRLADIYAFGQSIDLGKETPTLNMLVDLEKFLDQYVVKVDSKDEA